MASINKEIGERIGKRLTMAGKTQADLAAELNVTHSAVSSWVTGLKVPRMDKIDKICKFLNCSRSDILIENSKNDLSSSDRLLLYYYSLLNAEEKKKIDDLIHIMLLEKYDNTKENV